MFKCILRVQSTQNDNINTSKAEIERRSHTDTGYKPFNEWQKDKQKAAIKACGLAVSKFPNKQSRINILEYLAATDLPTNPEVVWSRIRTMNLNPSGATSVQQKAYLLLYNMTPPEKRVGLSKPPEPLSAKEAVGPGRELLAKTARYVLWSRMQQDTSLPPVAYRRDKQTLWTSRRQVIHNYHNVSMKNI